MKITNGVEALELGRAQGGQAVYPTLIWDENTVVLIDTGFPGQFGLLREAVKQAGVDFARISVIILTHQDVDHTGGLSELRAALNGKARIYCHDTEKPYIEGTRPLVKSDPVQFAKMVGANADARSLAMKKLIDNPPRTPVDETVSDGQLLPICGGIRILFTPGHTPGHICLLHEPSETLIAGDALTASQGVLHGPRPAAAADLTQAQHSLLHLREYTVRTVVCYHGGIVAGNVGEQLASLVQEETL